MEAHSLSTCNQCGKKFQRKAHLLRHQQQHSGDRPYCCKFCTKTFKRSDVLRDHFNRCDRRGISAIPSSLERGRKRHACNECSRLKVKCDDNVPCRKCREFGRTCVKTKSTGTPSPKQMMASPSASTSTPDSSSHRSSIGFLLNCSGATDFMREFPKSTTVRPNNTSVGVSGLVALQEGFEPFVEYVSSGTGVCHNYQHTMQGNNLDVFLSQLELRTFEERNLHWQMTSENVIRWPGSDISFPDRRVLEQRAFHIRENLKYNAASQNPSNAPSNEILEAVELITWYNIAFYVELYFKHWHKHSPIVHEASFNPCTAPLPLVLAIMSIGGMYSKEVGDLARLSLLLDTMEIYVYSIPGLNSEYDSPGRTYVRHGNDTSPECQQYQLEELQGAFLFIILQYWSGNAIARTRVRQQRFARILAIFRHLELQTVQHSANFVITDQESFRSWIRTESRIRIITMATMLDNTFGIFNNVSPRFQWTEIDLPFQCDERYFKLTSYDEMVSRSAFPVRKMKIKDAFLILFSPPERAHEDLKVLRVGKLTALDMQMLIHFLYTHIWSTLFNSLIFSLPSTSSPSIISSTVQHFKTAMNNWKVTWDELRSGSDEDEWKKLGYQRTAESYYDAVSAIVAVYERCGGHLPSFPSDCEKGMHLKRLLSIQLIAQNAGKKKAATGDVVM